MPRRRVRRRSADSAGAVSGRRATVAGLLVAAALASCRPAPEERERAAGAQHEAFAGELPRAIERAGVPGAVVTFLRRGTVVAVAAAGVSDTGTGEPMGERTIFPAGAPGEPVLAWAVLRLAQRGVIDLDAPLASLLADLEPAAGRVTARHVLTHTSGLPVRPGNGGRFRVVYPPGERFRYSGPALSLLQRAVEAAVGAGIDEIVRREVFDPLGMTDSRLAPISSGTGGVAVGHDRAGRPLATPRFTSARAPWTLSTTPRDYARFIVAVARGEGLAPETMREMLAPRAYVGDDVAWGLGWGLQRTEAGDAYLSWGQAEGLRSLVAVRRRDGTGLTVFANSDGGFALAREAVDAWLGGPQPALDGMGILAASDPRFRFRASLHEAYARGGWPAVSDRFGDFSGVRRFGTGGEALLNAFGYWLLDRGEIEGAIAVLRANAYHYPHSFNTHDSLGEALALAGEFEAAIDAYRRSLAIAPDDTNALRALDALGASAGRGRSRH